MPWFKVDDGFAFHRKAIKAGNAGIGLWVRAGSWCAQQLTDGHVPEEMLLLLGATTSDAEALVNAGLWVHSDGGYEFRGWHDFQPTKAEVEEERAKARERQKTWRKNRRNAGSNAVTDGVTNDASDAVTDSVSHGGSNDAPSLPDPSLPDPTITEENPEVADAPSGADPDDVPTVFEDRPDIERVCLHLVDRMVGNDYKRPAITNRWRMAAKMMLDRDGRTEQQIINAINWAHDSDFWRANVKSIPTLRKHYDALRLQAIAEAKRAAAANHDDDARATAERYIERQGGSAA